MSSDPRVPRSPYHRWTRGASGPATHFRGERTMLTKTKLTVAALALASFGWACRAGGADAAADKAIPAPAIDAPAPVKDGLETSVLAGGCFCGMEGMFQHVKGVTNVVSGYSGGTKETATYEMVSSERTGHAEAVEITF